MFHIILSQPEIPPNTGNIIRLCANIGASLRLIRPLGFTLNDAHLRRAGLDYREMTTVTEHDSLASATAGITQTRIFALAPFNAQGVGGTRRYDKPKYRKGDAFLFGCESAGLSEETLKQFPARRRLYIPMRPNNRSINLSNAAAITAMEAWRQLHYEGASLPGH